MSKNILLLGSNGYLGSKIKAQLRNEYSVFELNRKEIQALDFIEDTLPLNSLSKKIKSLI